MFCVFQLTHTGLFHPQGFGVTTMKEANSYAVTMNIDGVVSNDVRSRHLVLFYTTSLAQVTVCVESKKIYCATVS